MGSCLIVSSLDKSLDALSKLLSNIDIKIIESVKSAKEAKDVLAKQAFDMVLINAPLSDEFGHELTLRITEETTSGVLFLVKNELVDELSQKLSRHGVMVIGKPLNRSMFTQAVRMGLSTHQRLSHAEKENLRLHEKVENLELISRAKYTLMEYLNMGEAQAHHYIEKKAMDARISKEEVAKDILKTYG
ncbi:hypothetical protein A4S06_04325 [Erysipelotrichaceae bacterium MTC7]|nr:hypothetical protein A4S06_04325 [Erysipelotrichaceae bacterium MTC7]